MKSLLKYQKKKNSTPNSISYQKSSRIKVK